MTAQAITAFLLYSFISAFTPGPGNILALNTVANYGWSGGKRLFFGIFAGYYTVQFTCSQLVYGLNHMLNPVMFALKYIGAAYILYLAIHIAISRPPREGEQKFPSFWKGFILQFVNVKIYLFGITALTGYVLPFYTSYDKLVLFGFIIATFGTVATLTWILLGNTFQNVYQRHFRPVNLVLAAMLLECAWSMVR